jgi:hypothetical protein
VPQAPFTDLAAANEQAAVWCVEVNGVIHSEICAVPAEQLVIERELLAPLPSLRPSIGRVVTRKVDRGIVKLTLIVINFAEATTRCRQSDWNDDHILRPPKPKDHDQG